MAGSCCAIEADMACSSTAKSTVKGTPTKGRACNLALMAYITKPGSGDNTLAPGTAQTMANNEINSSEPLPNIKP